MANRLASATSPYLLQHALNPVDWWEWGPEAFAEARRRDTPILLSVGYAACHWCHVMAHESFEDPATAAYLNENFVPIKVDREERPDVDAVYMSATQAMTGQGGWPMTAVLTAEREPFFAGTYFPDRPRQGMPSFRQVLEALTGAWRDKREQVDRIGANVVAQLAVRESPDAAEKLGVVEIDEALGLLASQYDRSAGGFGNAPKFPPSMVLEWLLRAHARTGAVGLLEMVDGTCEAMARGGMYDQLGGGFARYSVDRGWVVPHFEKMLYDNAQLISVYLHWWRATDNALGRRMAEETADFLVAEMSTQQGGFASALDADSDGAEGTYYVWAPAQLTSLLGDNDAHWTAALLSVADFGTFENGTSTLQLRQDPDDPERWARLRGQLLSARAERVRPARDDKVVAAWNGLAISALAESSVLLDRPDLLRVAEVAADLLVKVHTDEEGRVWRTSRDGRRGGNAGVLEDYACVASGYLSLLGATGDPVWLDRAGRLLDQVLDRFTQDSASADVAMEFFDTASDAERLVLRPRDLSDNASPSGTSAAAHALLTYAAVTGSARHRDAALAAVAAAAGLARQAPRFAGWTLAAAEAVVAGPEQVAVVGDPGDPSRRALHRAACARTSPGAVVVVGEPDIGRVPLLVDRAPVNGRAAAYVCQGFVCDLPVTDPAHLR
ncbi:MAG: thioredoxin domain-containing protein [Nocardioidaceae bacterium]